MMNWMISAFTLAQVAVAASVGLTDTEHPWVPIDVTWTDEQSSNVLQDTQTHTRKLLGRRDLLQCSKVWDQCGGQAWNGPTCCESGSTCQNDGQNIWYSQCLPESDPIKQESEESEEEEIVVEATMVEESDPTPSSSGGTFSGDATYYSDGTIGACSQREKPAGFRAVALNSVQWDNGALCGTCIEGSYKEGYPVGSGQDLKFKAIIDNLCPECEHGDLDFRKDGIGSGDGRWPLTWSIIPCPSSGLVITRENGNAWYSKLKVEGGPGPVTSMKCKGMDGERTSDAFFEFQHDGSFCGNGGVQCSVSFNTGGSESISISKQELGGFC